MSIEQKTAPPREGDLIADARKHKGWGQRDLTEAARLSSVWRLSRIERNLQLASPDEAARIIAALTTDSPVPGGVRRPVRSIFAPLVGLVQMARSEDDQ